MLRPGDKTELRERVAELLKRVEEMSLADLDGEPVEILEPNDGTPDELPAADVAADINGLRD